MFSMLIERTFKYRNIPKPRPQIGPHLRLPHTQCAYQLFLCHFIFSLITFAKRQYLKVDESQAHTPLPPWLTHSPQTEPYNRTPAFIEGSNTKAPQKRIIQMSMGDACVCVCVRLDFCIERRKKRKNHKTILLIASRSVCPLLSTFAF